MFISKLVLNAPHKRAGCFNFFGEEDGTISQEIKTEGFPPCVFICVCVFVCFFYLCVCVCKEA